MYWPGMCTFDVSNLPNVYPLALSLFTQNMHTPNRNCSARDPQSKKLKTKGEVVGGLHASRIE